MWLDHWNLARDPFPPGGGPYVATPGHERAVARLVDAIAAGERRVNLVAGPGLGKSAVLARALMKSRTPTLRVALALAPADGPSLLTALARSLRLRVDPEASPARSWRALADAARLIRAQRGRLVLAVDSAEALDCRRDLDRLVHLDPGPDPVVTLIDVSRSDPDISPDVSAHILPLCPLTRGESSAYLGTRLALAGRPDSIFTPRALTLLHARSEGVPRLLDRLASRALVDAARSHASSIDGPLISHPDAERISLAAHAMILPSP